MSKIEINKRTEYEMVIPTNTFGGDRTYKTNGEGDWFYFDGNIWINIRDYETVLLDVIFQTHKGDITGEPSDDDK
jgi:hypothetical protein